MDIKQLSPQLSVSPQILPQDLATVQAKGFRAIICNRPDGEGADQPEFAQIAAAAKKLGLAAIYQPVVAGQLTDKDAAAFGKALADLPAPVLAFCRTGTRSTNLWSMAKSAGADA